MKKNSPIRFAIFAAIIGLIFTVGAALILFVLPKTEFAETQATIVAFEDEYDMIEEEWRYHTFVDYEVDGKKYTRVELGSYDTKWKEGDQLTIQYDVADPGHIQAQGSENIPYIIGGIGIVLLLVSAVIFIAAYKTAKNS